MRKLWIAGILLFGLALLATHLAVGVALIAGFGATQFANVGTVLDEKSDEQGGPARIIVDEDEELADDNATLEGRRTLLSEFTVNGTDMTAQIEHELECAWWLVPYQIIGALVILAGTICLLAASWKGSHGGRPPAR